MTGKGRLYQIIPCYIRICQVLSDYVRLNRVTTASFWLGQVMSCYMRLCQVISG
jgi:hypothetical protein